MSGRYVELDAGRYRLVVPDGAGPAGVHRGSGSDVRLDYHGGRIEFTAASEERVYVWWRGAAEQAITLDGPLGRAGETVAPEVPMPRPA